jgi:hypothetical protein
MFFHFTNWLTLRSRTVLEKAPIAWPLENFPKFDGTFHWFPSRAWWIQSTSAHPIPRRYILILFSHLHLCLPSDLFISGFPAQIQNAFHTRNKTKWAQQFPHRKRFNTWWWPYGPKYVVESFFKKYNILRTALWSSGQSCWLKIRRPGFDSRHYQKKK